MFPECVICMLISKSLDLQLLNFVSYTESSLYYKWCSVILHVTNVIIVYVIRLYALYVYYELCPINMTVCVVHKMNI